MHLDTSRGIGALYPNSGHFKHALVSIARNTQDRGQQHHWAEHLRFLTPARSLNLAGAMESDDNDNENDDDDDDDNGNDNNDDDDDGGNDDGGEFCSCSYHDSVSFRRSDRQLRLTSPTDTPTCVHYVAVSYCWSSSRRVPYSGEEFTVEEPRSGGDEVRRPIACPASLLDRVVQFAAWKGVVFIWIDQECIVQTDPLDQSTGIQAMDLMYQQAEYILAVLEVCVTEQRHLDALNMLYEQSWELEGEAVMRDVVEAMGVILTDPWVERAWCLQESTSGNRQMTLLIRCGAKLSVPTYFESEVAGCFELDLPWLHDIIAVIGVPLEPQVDHWSEAFQLRVRESMDLWYTCMPPDASREYDIDARPVCNAAQALCHLELRSNSVVSDRLAIMANLCRYEVRFNALAVDQLGHDFSICALALAVLNGDFSIQIGHQDYMQTSVSGRKNRLIPGDTGSSPSVERGFSWCLPASAALHRLSYYDHDGLPLRQRVVAASLEKGLALEGCLYITDRLIDMKALTSAFKDSSYKIPAGIIDFDFLGPRGSKMRPRARADIRNVHFILALLCKLHKEGFSGLVDMLWSELRYRGTTRDRESNDLIEPYIKAPFEDVIDVDTEDIKWPSPVPTITPLQYRHLAIRTHPFDNLDRPNIEYHTRTIISRDGLYVSRPARSPAQNSSYTTLFDGVELESKVFAPRSNGKLRVPHHYGCYPSNWLIREATVVDSSSTETQYACVRSICGMWEADERYAEKVVLQ